jgi:hypothetical protein
MSIDGHQKHSKAVENTGRNCLSTLASTLVIIFEASAVQGQQPGSKSMPNVASEMETTTRLSLRNWKAKEKSQNSTDNIISGKICKKILWRNRKRLRQLHNVLQSHVPLSTLYPADIIAMQPRPLCQLFLRVAAFITELPQCIAESGLNGACCHTLILES